MFGQLKALAPLKWTKAPAFTPCVGTRELLLVLALAEES